MDTCWLYGTCDKRPLMVENNYQYMSRMPLPLHSCKKREVFFGGLNSKIKNLVTLSRFGYKVGFR